MADTHIISYVSSFRSYKTYLEFAHFVLIFIVRVGNFTVKHQDDWLLEKRAQWKVSAAVKQLFGCQITIT